MSGGRGRREEEGEEGGGVSVRVKAVSDPFNLSDKKKID